MKFTKDMEERIDKALTDKKKEMPYRRGKGAIIGIGVGLFSDPFTTDVYRDDKWICELEDLSRMIEELTMLKEAIEEESGIIL